MTNPTTLVSPFAGDLSYSDSGAGGDWSGSGGYRFDGGLWLEEGTVNHVNNPTFEGGTATGWSQGNTTAVIISDGFDGTQAAQITADGDGNVFFYQTVPFGTTLNTGDKFSASVWIKAGTGHVGETVRFLVENSVGNGLISEDIALTAAGELYQRTATQNRDGETDCVFYVYKPSGATGFRYVVDAAQLELKPYATSFVAGTRAASSASVPTAGHITPGSGSMALRLQRKIDTGTEELYFECGTVGSETDALRGGVDASDHPFVEWNSNNAGWERLTNTATVSIGTEFVYLTDWDGTVTRLQIDDATIESGTRDAVEGDWGAGDLVLEAA